MLFLFFWYHFKNSEFLFPWHCQHAGRHFQCAVYSQGLQMTFPYPAVCELCTAYFCFCDTECSWINSVQDSEFQVQGCLCGHQSGSGLGHTSLCGQWEDLEIHPLHLTFQQISLLLLANPLTKRDLGGLDSASTVTVKSSTALPVHPGQTVTLLLSKPSMGKDFYFLQDSHHVQDVPRV